MTATSFPSRWAPQHPERIQLYSIATPNGQKIGIALEELELPYEAHRIDILKGDQFDPEFIAISPNSKIPAIIDPTGAEPLAIMESGAILLHLAEKTGQLLPHDAKGRSEVIQWLFFQVGSVGPMFGQFGHFYRFAKDKTSDDYAKGRYTRKTKRLLTVIDDRLEDREFLAGDYSIADIAMVTWVAGLDFYGGNDTLAFDTFSNIARWIPACLGRPAAVRGIEVCAF